jgi:hypothetical protein
MRGLVQNQARHAPRPIATRRRHPASQAGENEARIPAAAAPAIRTEGLPDRLRGGAIRACPDRDLNQNLVPLPNEACQNDVFLKSKLGWVEARRRWAEGCEVSKDSIR